MRVQHLEKRLALPCSVQALWDWHMRPEAFEDLTPPWRPVTMVHSDGVVADGSKVIFKVPVLGPIKQTWEAVHSLVEPPHRFRDTQVRGPFAHWQHDHIFEADGDGSVLIDRVEYALPMGWLGQAVAGGFIRRDLEKLFAHRYAVTRAALGGDAG